MTTQDLIRDLRSRINPAYSSQPGTESYERRLCAEALEAQAAEIERLRAENIRLLCAMQRLADWGGLPGSDHYSGTIASEVMQWFRGGIDGPLPPIPDWATGDMA